MLFLIDGDNNLHNGLHGVDFLSEDDTVLIFYNSAVNITKAKALTQNSKATVQYIPSVRNGKNSIDFQIITELGVLIGKNEVEYAYIISKDNGYLSSISSLKKRYNSSFTDVVLEESIEKCLKFSFIIKSTTKEELCDNFVAEYGEGMGSLMYNHISKLFTPKRGRRPRRKPAQAEAAAQAVTTAQVEAETEAQSNEQRIGFTP